MLLSLITEPERFRRSPVHGEREKEEEEGDQNDFCWQQILGKNQYRQHNG